MESTRRKDSIFLYLRRKPHLSFSLGSLGVNNIPNKNSSGEYFNLGYIYIYIYIYILAMANNKVKVLNVRSIIEYNNCFTL